MNILFVGDVFGQPGREALLRWLPAFKQERAIDFVIANGENVANGAGITSRLALKLLGGGVDVLTTGNHVWRQKEVYSFLATDERIVRPANYPAASPGRGLTVRPAADGSEVAVINMAGELFMNTGMSPFRIVDRLVSEAEELPTSSSSTCTRRRPARRSPWGTTLTAA
jgi:2',3'-cyclic-nucleotide 2'-phosphodiesterase